MSWKHLSIFAALVCMPISWTSAASDQRYNFLELIERIKADVIFLRHASAPGFGDPEDFNLADCSTQRNLDDLGRVQAVNIGIELKSSDDFEGLVHRMKEGGFFTEYLNDNPELFQYMV